MSAGSPWLRVPISYLLKLSLADVLGTTDNLPADARLAGRRVMEHLLNDNTSPRPSRFTSFRCAPSGGSAGPVARESAKRFLLMQLLCQYATSISPFRPTDNARSCISPRMLRPVRKLSTTCIADAFYRSSS